MSERVCERRDGQPKRAYATVQEAMTQIGYGWRYEPYQCPEHGWHIGTRQRSNVWRMLAVTCNKLSHVLAIIDSPKGDAAAKLQIIRRIVDAKGAYFDEPTNLGRVTSWPKSELDDKQAS
jgi:hypothetical protein